jgi:hypothetical protein
VARAGSPVISTLRHAFQGFDRCSEPGWRIEGHRSAYGNGSFCKGEQDGRAASGEAQESDALTGSQTSPALELRNYVCELARRADHRRLEQQQPIVCRLTARNFLHPTLWRALSEKRQGEIDLERWYLVERQRPHQCLVIVRRAEAVPQQDRRLGYAGWYAYERRDFAKPGFHCEGLAGL